MKRITVLVATVLFAPLIASCASADKPADPAPSAAATESAANLAFDPSMPLEAQMRDAIEGDDLALVVEILAAGFDPDADIRSGLNALHLVGYESAADLVPVLVAAGVPLEEKVNGMTPLVAAVAFGDAETVTAFLEAGADVTASNPTVFNAPPLHVAARWGNVEGIEALLDWGVSIESLDPANGTALIYAAYFGQYDAAMYLAEHGANLNQMDDFGDSPVVASERMGFPEIADALRALGAEG